MQKFEVTLKQLRKNKACISGYNKVVSALKGVEYVERETYIRFKHDNPISLEFILNSNGLDDALWCLRCDSSWDRDSRLFAVWCARQVQNLMTDERSINALDVAENFANGLASNEELSVASTAASTAARDASRATERAAASAAASAAAWDAAWAAAWAAASDAAWAAAWAMAASRAAASTAASAAAWDAAWAAAWAAASAAATASQKQIFIKMVNGDAPWQVGK